MNESNLPQTASVKDVWDTLLKHAMKTGCHSCCLSIREIAALSGYSRTTVKVAIRILCANGLITKHFRKDGDDGQQKNRYDIN